MKNQPQVLEEVGDSGFTHRIDLSWKDLFGVTIGVNTAKVFTIAAVKAGDHLVQAHLHLTIPFKVSTDAAFNSTTLDFGDSGSATRFFSGVQINENGTEVIDSYMDPTADFIYTGNDTLRLNLNSMAAKDMTNIDVGKLYLEYTLLRHSGLLKNPTY